METAVHPVRKFIVAFAARGTVREQAEVTVRERVVGPPGAGARSVGPTANSVYRRRDGRGPALGLASGLAFGPAGAFLSGRRAAARRAAVPALGLALLPGGRPRRRLTGGGVSGTPGRRNCSWRHAMRPLSGYWTSRPCWK